MPRVGDLPRRQIDADLLAFLDRRIQLRALDYGEAVVDGITVERTGK